MFSGKKSDFFRPKFFSIIFFGKYFLKKVFLKNYFSIEKNFDQIFFDDFFWSHIPILKIPKIPKIILRKLCDETWCLKTKYIIQNHVFYTVVISTFRWFRSHRKNNCFWWTKIFFRKSFHRTKFSSKKQLMDFRKKSEIFPRFWNFHF